MALKKAKPGARALTFAVPDVADKDEIVIEGLRQNNLKNLNLRIPHDSITAVVGLSGSGKSSLAFDTLFAEGRWRFIESLSTYTRLFLERMDRPDLDSIRNIRPAIAVEQKNPVRTSRSTVGTTTELNDYLRLLFARVGAVCCPGCGSLAEASDPSGAADRLIREHSNEPAYIGFSLQVKGKDPEEVYGALLARGFIRVISGGAAHDISAARPALTDKPLNVVADRLVIKAGERTRIAESLETAFREGGGDAWAEVSGKTVRFSRLLKCPSCGASVEKPTPLSLSFNHPVGACPECKGFGNILKYDEDKLVPDESLTLRQGAVEPWTKPAYTWWQENLLKHAPSEGLDLDKPYSRLTRREKKLLQTGADGFEGLDGFFDYLEGRKYKLHVKVFISRYKGQVVCTACNGARLRPGALNVRLAGLNIAELSRLSVDGASKFFGGLSLSPMEREVSKELLRQITAKLDFLRSTGLGYITLDRLTKTLSGGEAQRVTLATQLASTLSGVLYILDEPSIGLHPSDVDMLSKQVRRLTDHGNTAVIVEHDPAMIRASDHIVELGPGAGERGGRLVYSGPVKDFLRTSRTLTAEYLSGRDVIHVPRWRRRGDGRCLTLKGAAGNNLKGVDFRLPLKTMTCVTGVSGSGKSTLVVDTLYNALARVFRVKADRPLAFHSIEGALYINGVRLMDQSPIGRTPRSNPLTYIGGFDDIRRHYASMPSARALGYGPGDFSFNVPGGRCESCKGEGVEQLEMYFLPDVYVKCAACNGMRYKRDVLTVKYRGRSIYDCLNTTFEEAQALFPSEQNLQRRFSIIKEVGLGYLKLGQSATTLSGGEAQRLKIARELADNAENGMLYILDEPTTGLHMDDVKKLLAVLGRLVDAGNTVLLIEHNLDCIKTADHIIDLGPGGGPDGGRIIASGEPEEVARMKESLTGRYLKDVLQ